MEFEGAEAYLAMGLRFDLTVVALIGLTSAIAMFALGWVAALWWAPRWRVEAAAEAQPRVRPGPDEAPQPQRADPPPPHWERRRSVQVQSPVQYRNGRFTPLPDKSHGVWVWPAP